jgi:hypothetical protein
MQLLQRTAGAQIGIKKEPQRGDVIIAMIEVIANGRCMPAMSEAHCE